MAKSESSVDAISLMVVISTGYKYSSRSENSYSNIIFMAMENNLFSYYSITVPLMNTRCVK